MTNPIQRAGNHLHQKIVFGGADSDVFSLAAEVFESIDVDDLARALHAAECAPNCPRDVGDTDKRYARAMKNRLTGKEPQ